MNNASLNTLSDKLLVIIRRRPHAYYSPEQLAKKLRCKKSDTIFAVDLLGQAGYEIKSDRQGRYKFVSAPDLLLAAEIIHKLKTSFIGKHVYAYKSVQSTNTIASQLADADAPPGTLIVAESQTRGRGRLGRSWHSPEGKGIYLSIILYPKIDPVVAPGLSIMTAVSLAETIAGYKPKTLNIKWPNDCLVNGRKVAGILTELSAEKKHVNHVIVGVGINVNQRRRDFPKEISRVASSLGAELKKEIRRVEFLQKFLLAFERHYRRFEKSGLKSFRKKILEYSNLIGKKVRLDMSGKIITGKAVDIDANGNLVLDTIDGKRTFNAGEVTVVKGRKTPR
jgi:BirA family biotin operon repressor/biotin-[acetyl-CoA-carboxylase] ligase